MPARPARPLHSRLPGISKHRSGIIRPEPGTAGNLVQARRTGLPTGNQSGTKQPAIGRFLRPAPFYSPNHYPKMRAVKVRAR